MQDLKLILSGPKAAEAIPQLEAALDGAEILPAPDPLRDQAGAESKAVDPVAVAALATSVVTLAATIPSAVLAVMDLADRIEKRRRAKALIETAGKIRVERQVEVTVVTAQGPLTLADLGPDALLALVESNKPDAGISDAK